MKKFLTIIICLALAAGIGVGAYFLCKKYIPNTKTDDEIVDSVEDETSNETNATRYEVA